MPEGPEVETEKLHESIHEEAEGEEHRRQGLVRTIAVTTSLLAALAALASLRAGATVNEALALKTEATRLQAQASDQWAFYQAKGVKAAVQESIHAAWQAAGKEPPAEVTEKTRRYGEEQESIKEKAADLERERDAKEKEADHLLHVHHAYAAAVAFFQISIALGAIAALTRLRTVWMASVLVGIAGIASAAHGLIH